MFGEAFQRSLKVGFCDKSRAIKMEMRVSVVAGSPGQQTGIDCKPFLGAWPPRRCGCLRRLARKSAESVDRRGVCREWRARPLARGHQCPFLCQGSPRCLGCKACGSTASVRQVGVRERSKGSWTRGAVKPLVLHPALGLCLGCWTCSQQYVPLLVFAPLPQAWKGWHRELGHSCLGASDVLQAAGSMGIPCGGAGWEGGLPSHTPRTHASILGRVSTSGSRLQPQNGSDPLSSVQTVKMWGTLSDTVAVFSRIQLTNVNIMLFRVSGLQPTWLSGNSCLVPI